MRCSHVLISALNSGNSGALFSFSDRLLASLGSGGAERCIKAGQLLLQIGALIDEAGRAVENVAIGKIEDLNRRAKVLAAHAEVLNFDWLNELARGGQILVASYLHFTRGGLAVKAFRHHLAKEEFRAAINGISEALELLDRGTGNLPRAPEYARGREIFQQVAYSNRQLQTFIAVLEKNCDVDSLLLLGQVREYAVGVRTFASELRRLSDGMLASGRDDTELLALSSKCDTMANMMEERAEAIEEIDKSRDIYLPPGGEKVFVIHGHAEDKWRELRDLLEDKLGLKGRVIVLKEEASRSETVIQKFEKHAKQCCYGFALVTPDDEVKKQDAAYRQARPNVIFEIGWFYGHLGPSRLCILKRAGTEIPSDLGGVVTLEFDKAVGEVFLQIEQELEVAGIIAKK